MRGVFISTALAVFIPVVSESAVVTTFMNARVVSPSPDGRTLTVVGADGHSRTLAVDPRTPVRLANLRMGDEVVVTAYGPEDALVVTGVRVVETPPAASTTVTALPWSAGGYYAAQRQRPNPYSLLNPMFPRDSPKNPWARRRAAWENASVVPAVLRDSPR